MSGGLGPSALTLTLVCGPPGAGKSTLVRARAGPQDVLIELDDIKARLSGLPLYRAGAAWLAPALAERDRLLTGLAGAAPGGGSAWLVLLAPLAEDRQGWADLLRPAEVVVLETDLALCLARIAADPRRGPARISHRREAARWWRAYRRRPGETVIRAP